MWTVVSALGYCSRGTAQLLSTACLWECCGPIIADDGNRPKLCVKDMLYRLDYLFVS